MYIELSVCQQLAYVGPQYLLSMRLLGFRNRSSKPNFITGAYEKWQRNRIIEGSLLKSISSGVRKGSIVGYVQALGWCLNDKEDILEI